jgi:hypothetical protein
MEKGQVVSMNTFLPVTPGFSTLLHWGATHPPIRGYSPVIVS